MTVNEDNLKLIMRSLKALSISYAEKKIEVDKLIVSFAKIELDGILPKIDVDTHQPIIQERRDEIYDKCLKHVNEVLSINTDTIEEN